MWGKIPGLKFPEHVCNGQDIRYPWCQRRMSERAIYFHDLYQVQYYSWLCHLTCKLVGSFAIKGKISRMLFGLFWNGLPDINWFGHFLAFLKYRRKYYILWYIWRNLCKTCNILWISNLESWHFNKFGLFLNFEYLSFFKVLMAKFRHI